MPPPDQVDGLVEVVHLSPLTRHEKHQVFRLPFAGPADAESCLPSNEVIVYAPEATHPMISR